LKSRKLQNPEALAKSNLGDLSRSKALQTAPHLDSADTVEKVSFD
jgi:hypothetical protein